MAETDAQVVEGTLVCGTAQAWCRCTQAPHADGPHVCDCGGSWSIDVDGVFRIHAVPDPRYTTAPTAEGGPA
jgi:hypothetical protein